MEIVISTLEKFLNLRPADNILQKIAGIEIVSKYCNKHLNKNVFNSNACFESIYKNAN